MAQPNHAPVRINTDLHHRLKIEAAKQRLPLYELVEKLLEKQLDKENGNGQ